MNTGWSGGGMMGGGEMMGGGMSGGMDMKCSKYHMVEKGEGLYEIGAMYMKPAGAMLAANPWIKDRPNHYLYPGDKVCIP
ncbi:MAG: LysM peptidoglycan-binding domain-containing protein, partial [Anaerolineae bacterium]|nr:LysM peptidoglycan-binding domain-containing protein [Anaerolineae bacterium]